MAAAKKKVLVVGTGSIGERHTRCILATNRAEVSICEINDNRRKKIADNYKIKNSYADLTLALEAGHDAIVIATPAHLHIPMAQQAAESGLHLLIEKPLSISIDGIDHLDRTSRERKLVAGVAYVLRHIPVLAAMKKALDSGRFGRPLHITVIRGPTLPHLPTRLQRNLLRQSCHGRRCYSGWANTSYQCHMLARWTRRTPGCRLRASSFGRS